MGKMAIKRLIKQRRIPGNAAWEQKSGGLGKLEGHRDEALQPGFHGGCLNAGLHGRYGEFEPCDLHAHVELHDQSALPENVEVAVAGMLYRFLGMRHGRPCGTHDISR